MDLITTGGAAVTMTSDLLLIINDARVEYGEKEVRRNDFVARCKDELDGEHYETFVVKNPNGTESEDLGLTNDQCAYVSMRESKAVRRRVTSRLNALRAPTPAIALPSDYIQALEHLLASKKSEQAAIEQRDHAIATKAQIGSKREATAMANVAKANKEVARLMDRLGFNARHATVKAVEKVVGKKFAWLPLRKWCEANKINADDVPDPLYGTVKSWPADAWGEIYGIDLSALFAQKEMV